MAQVINTNLISLNAQRNLNSSQSQLATSLQRLSSGLRVNSAKDDAAGLAISERITTQVRGLAVAIRNASDGVSYAQTTEGALGKVNDILQRMRELAVQASNGTNASADRDSINNEYQQLASEARRTLEGTQFNGAYVFGSNAPTTVTLQIGANNNSNVDRLTFNRLVWTSNSSVTSAIGASVSVTSIAGTYAVSGTDGTNANAAIDVLDSAISAVNAQRATFGAYQNRFENVVGNLEIALENQAAARSRIIDADYASETASLSRAQILQQAGTAMVAQANQLPQQVLSLLRNF